MRPAFIIAAAVICIFCGAEAGFAGDSAATESTGVLETPPAPKAPYTLTDKHEIEIDTATNRIQRKIPSKKDVEKILEVRQVALAQCDDPKGKKADCTADVTSMHCMIIGDQYMVQEKYKEARAFYLEAMSRMMKDFEILEGDYKSFKADFEKTPPGLGDQAHIHALTEAYNAAKFYFYAYKDYAELARYQKRLVEAFISLKADDETIAEQWEIIENSVKSSAKYQRKFKANVMIMDGIRTKLPKKYMAYYKEIAMLGLSQKIEPR